MVDAFRGMSARAFGNVFLNVSVAAFFFRCVTKVAPRQFDYPSLNAAFKNSGASIK